MSSEKKDIFDRLVHLPVLRKAEPFYNRHKTSILYLFFGGLAFIVSTVTFWLFHQILGIHELEANVISWVITVLFAFFTNRVWVFDAKTRTAREFISQMLYFFLGRVVTLIAEEIILFIFITCLRWPSLPVKIAAQVVVILLNYFISKKLVFKKPQ